MLASFERRKQEWEFQKDLAAIEQQIAGAQETLAEDHYQITLQEKRIAEMGAENARDVLNFLSTKFTSAELYTWMAGIVGSVYRYFLQEATSIARLAQRQLAFERQERELPIILEDYWTYTDTSALLLRTGGGVERRGMTGSARLLQDITRLDQEAFFTDRRKLQLSKTISLALHDPIAFAQFRETGELHFGTAPEMFDRDFPGHYLRLIKRVRVSVIALVPPTEGIRATLSTNGISRVVTGGSGFAEEAIVREPERVALTAPINATGLFDLQEQPEMLLPFEGTSVAASWVFSMPRASNPLDYGAIADVLVTIEYTALHSDVYRQQVIGRLNRAVDGARPFSFRQQFADQWYDLHNPDYLDPEKQMAVTFETRRGDFPPNMAELKIQHVALYFSRKDGFTDEIPVELRFLEAGRAGQVGGSASTLNGQISTGNQNAASWQSMLGKQPVGKWELKLPNGTKDLVKQSKKWFTDGQIEDILFVIMFSGVSPEWHD